MSWPISASKTITLHGILTKYDCVILTNVDTITTMAPFVRYLIYFVTLRAEMGKTVFWNVDLSK